MNVIDRLASQHFCQPMHWPCRLLQGLLSLTDDATQARRGFERGHDALEKRLNCTANAHSCLSCLAMLPS